MIFPPDDATAPPSQFVGKISGGTQVAKSTLDKDLGKVVKLETATYSLAR